MKLDLYTGPNCPGCLQAKRWLAQVQIPYTEIDITQRRDLIPWLSSVTGQRTIPQFFVDGQWVRGGLQELQQMVARRGGR